MWKNMEEPDRPQMTLWRMRIACYIPNTTNAHVSICYNYSFSSLSTDARTSLGVIWYVHCLSCWLLATNVRKN